MGSSPKIMCPRLEVQETDLAGGEPVREARLGFADLPETCIASILGLATPKDVARLACASRAFRDVSSSDQVWQMMLPPHYHDILAQDPNSPPTTCSKKAIFDYLRNGLYLRNGTQKFWLDQSTGGVCMCIGARGLFIVWGDDDRYWLWRTLQGSRFSEVAYLRRVCWFEVCGKLQSYLPPGTYTLSWRVLVASGHRQKRTFIRYGRSIVSGWSTNPAKFSLEATDNESVDSELYLTEDGRAVDETQNRQPTRFRYARDIWMEIGVGQFTVQTGDSPVELKFSMVQIEGGNWKSGMYLDGVVIRPSSVHLNDQ